MAEVPLRKMGPADFMAEVRRQAEDDRCVPNFAVLRLLSALDEVLKAHRDAGGRCAWCRNPDGRRQKFPCGEYLAITAELTGKAADGG